MKPITAECKRVSVTAEQIAQTATTATYRCTVSRKGKAWFGYNNNDEHLILKKADSYYKWWGFPKKADWTSKMGTPAKNLVNGSSKTLKHGGKNVTVPSVLNQKVTWEEEVIIPRPESGKAGTREIKVGVEVGPKTDFVSKTLVKLTLKTEATSFPTVPAAGLSLEYVPVTGTSGYVICNAAMKNWSHLFKLVLEVLRYKTNVGTNILYSYEKPDDVSNWSAEYIKLAESNHGTISNVRYHLIPEILKNSPKARQNITFRIRVTPANGLASGIFSKLVTYSRTISVPSNNNPITNATTRSLHFKEGAGDYEEIEQTHLKNNNAKYLKEIWIKKDGRIYQIK